MDAPLFQTVFLPGKWYQFMSLHYQMTSMGCTFVNLHVSFIISIRRLSKVNSCGSGELLVGKFTLSKKEAVKKKVC